MTETNFSDITLVETCSARLREESKRKISDRVSDFYAKYYAVSQLLSIAQKNPEILDPDTIDVLKQVLTDPQWASQRQGLFLCRQAAETLAAVVSGSAHSPLAIHAFAALTEVLATANGHAHRATAESTCLLPLSIYGPPLPPMNTELSPKVGWPHLLRYFGFKIRAAPVFYGRSLVAELAPDHRLLVIKLARQHDSPADLLRESAWMAYLRMASDARFNSFCIPEPVTIGDSYLLRLETLPVPVPESIALHPMRYGIGFIAHEDYFRYPNEIRKEKQFSLRQFEEIIFKNAELLGDLCVRGIIHTAPIPLFHNRVQADRRRDHGVYEWFRAGRLDRWLHSCTFPNLGPTGLRDFEHVLTFNGRNRELYRYVGNHFLSLLLITGSYFRNKDRDRIGCDRNGIPVDARDLFDRASLKSIISGIFKQYYQGFVGSAFKGELPIDLDRLTRRMIEEMGVDQHMEEILRVTDQEAMTDPEFRAFLCLRGYSEAEAVALEKGISDIAIQSGPHLGAFNRPISLPEIIEAVETMSALCMAGRYLERKGFGLGEFPKGVPNRWG